MSVALVPVKRLRETKSRLFEKSDALARDDRGALALAMLEDVIAALRDARSVDRVLVVTPDTEVAATARAAGAEALVRDDPGLNAALERGARDARLAPDEPLLVLLGDVAGAQPADIDALFAALAGLPGDADGRRAQGVVLAPSSDGGSSALLRAPADVIPACFGPDSAKRHREAATARGVPFRELALPSLALDLDLPEDVERFLKTSTGGAATRRALSRETP